MIEPTAGATRIIRIPQAMEPNLIASIAPTRAKGIDITDAIT
jgi:hypothetical protein